MAKISEAQCGPERHQRDPEQLEQITPYVVQTRKVRRTSSSTAVELMMLCA
jgi:hypothetical protein